MIRQNENWAISLDPEVSDITPTSSHSITVRLQWVSIRSCPPGRAQCLKSRAQVGDKSDEPADEQDGEDFDDDPVFAARQRQMPVLVIRDPRNCCWVPTNILFTCVKYFLGPDNMLGGPSAGRFGSAVAAGLSPRRGR